MILRIIDLQDFGLYRGAHSLDLTPTRGKPVVLFGGKNGVGKTTLLEAVRLALYGKRALGIRVGQAEYEDHLMQRLHVDRDGQRAEFASVSLEFDYAEAGRVQNYRVRRSWAARGNRAIETLELEKDGSIIDEVPQDEWQAFLQELIPPGVSQLFFFDGEKIADIASDEPDKALADAIRGLLGFELVGRLRTDIGLYLARRARDEEDLAADRLEAAVRDLKAVEQKLNRAFDEQADAEAHYRSQLADAERIQERFTAEGGEAARRRGDLEGKSAELREQIAEREAELRGLMNATLPLAMAPGLISRFNAHTKLRGEIDRQRQAALLSERLLGWRAADEPARRAKWTASHWQDLTRFLQAEEALAQTVDKDGALAGERVEPSIIAMLTAAETEIPQMARHLVADIDRLAARLAIVDAELERANGKAAGILLDDLLQSQRDVALAEAQLTAKAQEFKSLEYRQESLEREKRRALEAQTEAAASQQRVALAGRVSRVLQRYEEKLLDLKIDQLRAEFVDRFNYLVRKKGFVSDVHVDPRSFETVLIGENGNQIRKASLSAGEKQIYAVAMLWALARTSGRALPMIIDTPLARLDQEHRSTIVERYFPSASHQVLVLSTDTEVDGELLDRLSPSVSHSFRLEFDDQEGATQPIPGYFNDEISSDDAVQQA
tara:strand:- start:13733 stop:15730 length:1998 start_codon:yes stop_codon:yes gene_type:complete